MNRTRHDGDFSEADRREWLAQERALAEQRAGQPDPGDPRLRAYRMIARAAAEPPPGGLPADFAQRTARLVVQRQAVDESFERRLLAILMGTLVVAGGAAMAWFAPAWLPSLGATAASLGSPLPWALAVCLALSGLYARWDRGARLHA